MSANSPNPLVPQGSLQQQSGKAKQNVRVAVFSIIAVHAVLIVGVLMQGGCKKDEPKQEDTMVGQPSVPATDPYHSDPSALMPTTPSTDTAMTPGPGAFGEPAGSIPTAGPIAPTGPATPTTPGTLPPTGPAPIVGPGAMTPTTPVVTPMAEPAAPVQQYKIEKGDNFYTIAKKLKTTTKKIIEANPNVDPARLKIGQMINVPASASAPAAPTSMTASLSAPAESSSGSTISYEVKAGDTLYGIAKKYGTTVKAIQSASGLKTTAIKPKQVLKVPSKATAAAPAPEPVITAPASVTPVTPTIPGNQ